MRGDGFHARHLHAYRARNAGRLGLSPPRSPWRRATNNYALQFGWNELGQIAPGRRADILVLDGDPTVNTWNVRRISTLIVDGNTLDREGLLTQRH